MSKPKQKSVTFEVTARKSHLELALVSIGSGGLIIDVFYLTRLQWESFARIRGCSRQNISDQAGQMGFHYIRTLVIDPQ